MNKIKILILITLILLPSIVFAADDETGTTINLVSLNLAWDADTYTPFNYEGRALPTTGSSVTVDAMLKITGGDARTLKYSWFLDDIFQENKSGYAKTDFTFWVRRNSGSLHTVLVKIFNDDRSFYTEKSIQIPIVAPELIAYSTGNNSHFTNQANKISTVISGKEFSLTVKPYFFSIKKLTDLTFKWNLSGREPIISSGFGASILKLTVNNNGGGEVEENSLWISAINTKDPRQKATQTIKLNIY